MINVKLKDVHSPDVPSVWQWAPSDAEEVSYFLEMEIGPEESIGSDLFFCTVKSTTDSGEVRGQLRLPGPYNWRAVQAKLNHILKQCSAQSWPECVEKLCSFFFWEYEDYTQVQ